CFQIALGGKPYDPGVVVGLDELHLGDVLRNRRANLGSRELLFQLVEIGRGGVNAFCPRLHLLARCRVVGQFDLPKFHDEPPLPCCLTVSLSVYFFADLIRLRAAPPILILPLSVTAGLVSLAASLGRTFRDSARLAAT